MKNRARTLLLLLGDIVALIVSFFVMLNIRFFGKVTAQIIELHLWPFSILIAMWLIIFFVFNLYDTETSKPTIPHLKQTMLAFISATMLGVIFFYIIPVFNITPKTNLLIFSISAFVFFIVWRRIFYHIFSSHFKKSVVFIARTINENAYVKDLILYIATYPQSGFFISGTYNSPEEFFKQQKEIPDAFILTKEVWDNADNFKKLYGTESDILDLAYAYEEILGRIPIDAIDESWFIHNISLSDKKTFDLWKRILSIAVVIITCIIFSPFIVIIALLIKLHDQGPVFYHQTRVGKNGRKFELYKFRSMVMDAEKNGPQWASHKDSRVTPIGKIIRKIHLDELPQLWNIVTGDILFVGPRPERPEFVEKLEKEIPFYYLRHDITPGFTGWAQIKFRYARSIVDSKEKFEYDLYYLKNRNIFMDLGIVIRTIQIIFTHV